MQQFRQYRRPLYSFPTFKEIEGKKYQYGGEYPYNKEFAKRLKNVLKSNGYHVHFQFKKQENKVIVWTRRK